MTARCRKCKHAYPIEVYLCESGELTTTCRDCRAATEIKAKLARPVKPLERIGPSKPIGWSERTYTRTCIYERCSKRFVTKDGTAGYCSGRCRIRASELIGGPGDTSPILTREEVQRLDANLSKLIAGCRGKTAQQRRVRWLRTSIAMGGDAA